jgi:hypothetical protein
MEAVEGPASVPANRPWEAGSPSSKPTISSAAEGTEETKNPCHRRREGHHKKIFFRAPVIARVDTRNLTPAGGRRCSASVPMHAAGLSNEFWSESGVGGSVTPTADKPSLI